MGVAIKCILDQEIAGGLSMEGNALAMAYCGTPDVSTPVETDISPDIIVIDFGGHLKAAFRDYYFPINRPSMSRKSGRRGGLLKIPSTCDGMSPSLFMNAPHPVSSTTGVRGDSAFKFRATSRPSM